MFRNRKVLTALLAFATLTFSAGAVTTACVPASGGRGCCRVCVTGKPCGNSCIARNLTCHKGGGCACFGNNVDPATEAEWLAAMEPIESVGVSVATAAR